MEACTNSFNLIKNRNLNCFPYKYIRNKCPINPDNVPISITPVTAPNYNQKKDFPLFLISTCMHL